MKSITIPGNKNTESKTFTEGDIWVTNDFSGVYIIAVVKDVTDRQIRFESLSGRIVNSTTRQFSQYTKHARFKNDFHSIIELVFKVNPKFIT
jgi:hypothetical protein